MGDVQTKDLIQYLLMPWTCDRKRDLDSALYLRLLTDDIVTLRLISTVDLTQH